MARRTVAVGAAKYRRTDGVWLLAMMGAEVDVHPDEVDRFDRLNVSQSAPVAVVAVDDMGDDEETIEDAAEAVEVLEAVEAPEVAEVADAVDAGDDGEAVDLDAMTRAELIEFAAVSEIALGDAKTKTEILAVLRADNEND